MQRTTTISITSGKGGVGKSTIVSNLAVYLARKSKRVLIFDGDLGMANVDIMFGVRPKGTIYEVLEGEKTLQEILTEVSPGVFLIPGGSGIVELQRLSDHQKQFLLDQVGTLENSFDYMLVDTAPGIDETVLYLNAAVNQICVVLTPDPSSVADSYALMKVLNKYHRETRFSIICNQVRDEAEGLNLYRKISDIAARFLYVSLDYKGSVVTDPLLNRATKAQQLILNTQPMAASCVGLRQIGDELLGTSQVESPKGGIQFFWEQLFSVA